MLSTLYILVTFAYMYLDLNQHLGSPYVTRYMSSLPWPSVIIRQFSACLYSHWLSLLIRYSGSESIETTIVACIVSVFPLIPTPQHFTPHA